MANLGKKAYTCTIVHIMYLCTSTKQINKITNIKFQNWGFLQKMFVELVKIQIFVFPN